MARRWDDVTGIVTPEAVELRLQDADVGSRGVALLFDLLILAVTGFLLNLSVGWLIERSDLSTGWIATTILIILNFLLILGYPIAFETLTRGKTPGKAAMGLRAVTVEGSPVLFRHAAIRGVFWLVDFFATVGVGALVAALVSKRHQRLGDMVAGTVVVRERTAAGTPRVARYEVAPGLADYAATIDTSSLSVRDYEIVRELLLRQAALDPRRRYEIASRLMTAIAAKLRTEPPNIEPIDFLTCVASRYQQGRGDSAVPPPVATPASPVPPASVLDDFGPPALAPGDFTPPR